MQFNGGKTAFSVNSAGAVDIHQQIGKFSLRRNKNLLYSFYNFSVDLKVFKTRKLGRDI